MAHPAAGRNPPQGRRRRATSIRFLVDDHQTVVAARLGPGALRSGTLGLLARRSESAARRTSSTGPGGNRRVGGKRQLGSALHAHWGQRDAGAAPGARQGLLHVLAQLPRRPWRWQVRRGVDRVTVTSGALVASAESFELFGHDCRSTWVHPEGAGIGGRPARALGVPSSALTVSSTSGPRDLALLEGLDDVAERRSW